MAIFHLHVKNISRGDGRSVVAAAAYRAGETLPNEAEEGLSAFGGRRDVVFTEIRLPMAAPEWMEGRAQLWNAVEAAEKRKDARLAKEIEFALPRELSLAEWVAVARDMADAYTSRGHVVDLAIHSDATRENPHVHLLLTTRAVSADGFGGKMREADGRAFVNEARLLWEKIANGVLGSKGGGARIDARSLAARGLDQKPTVHRGPDRIERQERRERAAAIRSRDLDDPLAELHRLLAEPPRPKEPPMTQARTPREIELEARNQELERELASLRAELHTLTRAEERSLTDLDPLGNVVTRGELEDARERMVKQVERSPAANPQPPRPERLTAGEREKVRAEVDRQNAALVPERDRDDDLAWLRTSADRREGREPESSRDPDLDWLRKEDRDQEQFPEHERDRER